MVFRFSFVDTFFIVGYDSALLSVNLMSAIVHLEIMAFILFPVLCILYVGAYCYKQI